MSENGSVGGDGSGPGENRVELVVITGYSGAGKSEAIAALKSMTKPFISGTCPGVGLSVRKS